MNGWTYYIVQPPPPGALVRFSNDYNGQQWTGYVKELPPEFNVGSLWWKLTGIERMKRGL